MNAFDLPGRLTPENRLPFYFLFGPERFLATEIVNTLTRQMVTDDNRDFNFEAFTGSESSPGDWINSARTLSFFGGDKLVVVHAMDDYSWDDKSTALILDYAKNPAEGACLVMTAQKADRKRKLFKSLCALPGAVDCSPPNEGALAPWLAARAKSRGYNLSAGAAGRMVDRIGPLPGRLAAELEKVLTYAGGGKKISEDDIASVVGDIRLEAVFDLTDALKEKNTGRALKLLHKQLDHGEEPLKLLGTIAWQFRLIWEIKCHQQRRVPAAGIARVMGQKPFVVEKAARYTRNFSDAQLKEGLRALASADRELKSTNRDPTGVMETLLLRLCRS